MAPIWTGGSASSLCQPGPGTSIVGRICTAAEKHVDTTTEEAAVEAVLDSYIDACRWKIVAKLFESH